ncbi:hypothetical protein JB92DRAFT_2829863 [Gautieria morchelliformis]|nr:hypothetical protein JB92DRAFT_2829863 [Gautieria morchelliformis]
MDLRLAPMRDLPGAMTPSVAVRGKRRTTDDARARASARIRQKGRQSSRVLIRVQSDARAADAAARGPGRSDEKVAHALGRDRATLGLWPWRRKLTLRGRRDDHDTWHGCRPRTIHGKTPRRPHDEYFPSPSRAARLACPYGAVVCHVGYRRDNRGTELGDEKLAMSSHASQADALVCGGVPMATWVTSPWTRSARGAGRREPTGAERMAQRGMPGQAAGNPPHGDRLRTGGSVPWMMGGRLIVPFGSEGQTREETGCLQHDAQAECLSSDGIGRVTRALRDRPGMISARPDFQPHKEGEWQEASRPGDVASGTGVAVARVGRDDVK